MIKCDLLPDLREQLDEIIGGDFAAVLAIERRELPVHVQAALSIFEDLPGSHHGGQAFPFRTFITSMLLL